jgi:hypothetical protein
MMKFFRSIALLADSRWSKAIKVISTVLISSAIALELWNLCTHGFDRFESLMPIVWFERFALVAHGLEGVISAFLAPGKGEKPIPYAVYTFFVGTIGLWELFDRKLDSPG